MIDALVGGGTGRIPRQPTDTSGNQAAPIEAVRGKHVLIVGINYAPEPTGIAPYTTATAEHLALSAASVTVLAGLPCYPSWRVADPYRGQRRIVEERNGVFVHRLEHVVPVKQDALRRGAYEFSYLFHAVAKGWAKPVDLVLGVTPALGGAVAAAVLARRSGARYAVVVQDLLGEAARQSGIAAGGSVAGVVRRMESWALRQADSVAVVSDSFREPLAEYGVATDRIHTVRNWSHTRPAVRDRAKVRAELGWREDTVVALHAGNMGLKQDLENVVEAARLTAHRSDLLWVLMGDGSQRAQIERAAAGLPNLQLLSLCPDDEYGDRLAAADLLLLNERKSVTDMCLPSKLTGYFRSGRPVAGAVGAHGATAIELANAGAPAPVRPNDPAALANLVATLAGSQPRRDRHGRAALQYADSTLTFAAAMARLEQVLG